VVTFDNLSTDVLVWSVLGVSLMSVASYFYFKLYNL